MIVKAKMRLNPGKKLADINIMVIMILIAIVINRNTLTGKRNKCYKITGVFMKFSSDLPRDALVRIFNPLGTNP